MLSKEEAFAQLSKRVNEMHDIACEFVGENIIAKKELKRWFVPFIEELKNVENSIDDIDDLEVLEGEKSKVPPLPPRTHPPQMVEGV